MADDNIDMDQKSENLTPNTEQIQEPEIGLNSAENGVNINRLEQNSKDTPIKKFLKIYTIIYGMILGMCAIALLITPQQCRYQDTVYTEGFAGGERYEFIRNVRDYNDINDNIVQTSVTIVVEDFNSCARNNQFTPKPTFPAYEPYIGEIGVVTLLIGIAATIFLIYIKIILTIRSNILENKPKTSWKKYAIYSAPLLIVLSYLISVQGGNDFKIRDFISVVIGISPYYLWIVVFSFLLYQKLSFQRYVISFIVLCIIGFASFLLLSISINNSPLAAPLGGLALLLIGVPISIFIIWSLIVILPLYIYSNKKKKLENIPTENKI